jgi:hypothetical protein
MPTFNKIFTFATNTDGWTSSAAGNGTTGGFFDADGQTAGSIFSRCFGRNNNGTVTWAWTGTFASLGMPVGARITGYTLCSYSHRAFAWVVGSTPTQWGALTFNDGVATRTIMSATSYTGLTSWATKTNNLNVSGLLLSRDTPISFNMTASVRTANNASAEVRILLDNLRLDITYEDTPAPKYYITT